MHINLKKYIYIYIYKSIYHVFGFVEAMESFEKLPFNRSMELFSRHFFKTVDICNIFV